MHTLPFYEGNKMCRCTGNDVESEKMRYVRK